VSPQSHNYCADHGHGRAASHVYAPLLFGTAFAIGTFLNLGSSPSSSCVACSLTRPLCSLMPGIIILPTPSGSWRHGSRPFSRAAHPARLTPMTSGDRHRRERPDRLAICGRSPFGHEPARRFSAHGGRRFAVGRGCDCRCADLSVWVDLARSARQSRSGGIYFGRYMGTAA
jgi:hypothetical protein